MCELLICVVDKVHPDLYVDANHCFKRGDVIAVEEDDHVWGREELAHPDWKIVKVSGVSRNHATGFIAPEYDEHLHTQSRVLQARAFRYDLDARPTDYASLMAAKISKPKLIDPNVIG